ncbi:MAG: RagB/SusD family nutrient uptake outer membrane protein [Segetibacter sp.]
MSGDLLDDFNNQWNNWYQGVRDCNFSIIKIPGISGMTADEKSKSLGELRTLRAWYYFCLVRYFGDVVMDTSILVNLKDAQLPFTSLKTIYDEVILPDLEFAVNESTLADTKSNNGRITKYIARAILSDVYLTCSGYPYQEVATDPTKKWCTDGLWTQQGYPVNSQSAKTFLKKAQEQLNVLYGQYALGTYHDLHDPAKNNTGEAIFQAQMLSGVTDNQIIQASLPGLSHVSMFGDENGTFIPSVGYFNSYNSSDIRIQDRQMFYFSDNRSKKYDPSEGSAEKFSMPHLYKFYDLCRY